MLLASAGAFAAPKSCTTGLGGSLVLPPVVGGVALFLVLGRQGIVGRWLDEAFGITLPFSTAAVVMRMPRRHASAASRMRPAGTSTQSVSNVE